jgi:hypothetical protein
MRANDPLKPYSFRNAQPMLLTFILLHLSLDCPYADRALMWELVVA